MATILYTICEQYTVPVLIFDPGITFDKTCYKNMDYRCTDKYFLQDIEPQNAFVCKHDLISIPKMVTSSNGNIFRVTGPSRGEFTVGLWCFLWSAPEQTVEQTIETPVIRDAIVLIMRSLWFIQW